MNRNIHIGLDVGSTTVKVVAINHKNELLHSSYQRHLADARTTTANLLQEALDKFPGQRVTITVAGSGGISIAEGLNIPFAQEVISCTRAIEEFLPNTDVAIELGGEDAKITFFDENSVDQRMNETCAGGTGAFIDQIATLLMTDAAGLNDLAKNSRTLYPIASRCGVFPL